MSDMSELVGHTVTQLENINNGEAVRFTCADGAVFFYEAVGDCCSHSWFNDFTGVDCLLWHTVAETDQVSLAEWWETDGVKTENGDENIAEYSIKITTERGVCEIIYRNSSNGYYGGWCERVEDYQGTAKPILADV